MNALLAILLGACGTTSENSVTPEPTPSPPSPAPTKPVAEAPAAAPSKNGCTQAFSSEGATQVYVKLSSLKGDCTFDGVKTSQWDMELQWLDGEDMVSFHVLPKVCADALGRGIHSTDGQIALIRPDDAARKRCPESFATLARTLQAGGLVTPISVGAQSPSSP